MEQIHVSLNRRQVARDRVWSDVGGNRMDRVFPRERVEWIRVRSDGGRSRIGQSITRGYERIWMELSNKL